MMSLVWNISLGAIRADEMGEKLTLYDPADDLLSVEAIEAFMEEALTTGDAAYIAHAHGVVARAKEALGIELAAKPHT